MYAEDCSSGAAALSEPADPAPAGGSGLPPAVNRKKAAKAKTKEQLALVAAPQAAKAARTTAQPESGGGDGNHSADEAPVVDTPVDVLQQLSCGPSGELLLWLLATGRAPDAGWYRATGLTQGDLAQLSRERAPRLCELKLLRLSAELIGDEELLALLRAKAAALLLQADDSSELTALMRSAEKLPAFYAATHRGAAASRQADNAANVGDIPEMSLDEALCEARSIVNALERAGALGED